MINLRTEPKKIVKNIDSMTRKEFETIPSRERFDSDVGSFDSIVILPSKRTHDSGYRLLDFVAIKEGIPLYRLSGCSDVLHINGIGGYGIWSGSIPTSTPVHAWNIDCLKKSGLLQLWCLGKKLRCGEALSSFEIFVE